ncbi:Circadian-associated transcriptional repressor ChIP-derived repressor of network oscillator [Larimichthys crocea]|uniref:Circadian-associated transcriptional repressor ChIP-derived repressor of network oscillator n=1 Tax=Larimichthys crocea TaxID=215358 RepID=A0A0F8AIA6_LARCR|nr:circadian-associated transcriptional repressor [Larimichthys crocea]KAE8296281.1 Circadian-associated transcriptional repressor ChIP-derived repressor of network oscillator [Larimichthys crocea]
MSATDSDNSIDWLASDYEDNESEQEFDYTRKHSQTEALPSPSTLPHLGTSDSSCRRSSEVKEGDSNWDEVREASSRESSAGCKETRDSVIGLYKTQQGEKTNGRNTQQALKRPRSSTDDECKERQLISNMSEKSRVFSRKCMELQCYIHPLSSILNGLRSGRYRERLSSFQESVAMDRIQRIMGVLQNPCMGEKYINIILKMEEMLKSWFPNVKLQDQLAVTQTEEAVPTKKPKLSPVTSAAAASPVIISDPPNGVKPLRVTDLTPPGAYSASNLKWLHTSPICSPTAEQAQAGPRHPLFPRDRDLTQDNAVSSSTDSHTKTDSVPRGPPPGKINAPCLERLLKSTESIITRKGTGGLMDSSWS